MINPLLMNSHIRSSQYLVILRAYSVQSPVCGRYTLESVEFGPHLVSLASEMLFVPAEIFTVYHSLPYSSRMTNWKSQNGA